MKKSVRHERSFWYTLARILIAIYLWLFFPTRYINKKRFRELDAPYMIVANHLSNMDSILIAHICPYEVRFLGKESLRKNKIARFILDKLHMIGVERHASDMNAMRECVRTLENGHVLGIFPEGTRSKDGEMHEFLSGAGLIALRSRAKIIPVRIEKKAKPFIRNNVYIGEAVEYADILEKGVNKESCNELMELIREQIVGLNKKNENFA